MLLLLWFMLRTVEPLQRELNVTILSCIPCSDLSLCLLLLLLPADCCWANEPRASACHTLRMSDAPLFSVIVLAA